ncbi:cob(I)yrinic acid a,c-diamide adenosyltransferase [Falsirhodobacter halotolerans]|uniref:cob(I)yrinic acid a,c-diamide adenosyltransferase n=1 Tax=Falsirhodobacter halotolerans TaxID=1146892 RepID=UPI001FD5DD79|nr:cob(I)yrinic acid a,c-diamide adenosyltransferase [Falsirhodobacter halotolerans]MCJ8138497.1 cob(I)yrinic acid a,c-diamide adenosyltransferase [Falsirhodobacter halotolerans]
MVTLSKIYTRTGDDGTSGLADGRRLPKTDARFAAIGAVDEVNATIGLCRLHAQDDMAAALARISNDLFDLGADLALPATATPAHPPLRILPEQVARLEKEIDAMNAPLAPLKSFILPGGTPLAAHLHLARTVCRRAERDTLSVPDTSEPARRYLNRLSDWLFVAARAANGASEILWQPGLTRPA